MFDKFREECGVFGIYGHPESANLAYLGIYAMQHRGQESAGIAASDGQLVRVTKDMGQVSEVFNAEVLAKVPGHIAIGHTRYSTSGDSHVSNAQPLHVATRNQPDPQMAVECRQAVEPETVVRLVDRSIRAALQWKSELASKIVQKLRYVSMVSSNPE